MTEFIEITSPKDLAVKVGITSEMLADEFCGLDDIVGTQVTSEGDVLTVDLELKDKGTSDFARFKKESPTSEFKKVY